MRDGSTWKRCGDCLTQWDSAQELKGDIHGCFYGLLYQEGGLELSRYPEQVIIKLNGMVMGMKQQEACDMASFLSRQEDEFSVGCLVIHGDMRHAPNQEYHFYFEGGRGDGTTLSHHKAMKLMAAILG